jgi:hypothetical protein
MNVHLLDAGSAAASIAVWYAAYLVARLVTRPAAVRSEPATPNLGDEPPAVVSLLTNRWELTEDAAEATLLDLAARGFLELRQPAEDPLQTTIQVRDKAADGLLTFERQVLDRVTHLAQGGVLPVTALTFRDSGQAEAWEKRLRVAVVAEARRRGLSRRRFSPALVTALTVLAAGVGAVAGWAAFHWMVLQPSEDDDSLGGAIGGALVAGFLVFGSLGAVIKAYQGERDTPMGRTVAARWLGVRQWLRGHEAFADLPPSAVAVWDRYLPYGAAVGATRVASAVLDLGMGDRKRVWSSHGGQWHRVRVRYPRVWPRYGKSAPHLVKQGLGTLAAGCVLIWLQGKPRMLTADIPELAGKDVWFSLADNLLLVIGLPLALLGAYKLIRILLDLATARTFDGQVLWVEAWPSTMLGKNDADRSYLAIDDGDGDRTVAWARPAALGGRPGDTVRVTVRRWTRRVVRLEVTQRGGSGPTAVGPATFEELDPTPS